MRLKTALILACATAFATGCSQSSGVTPALFSGTTASNSAQRTIGTPFGAGSIVPSNAATHTTSVCAKPVDPARAGCFASFRTDSVLSSAFPDAVNGLTPTDLASLYAYPAPGSQGSLGAGKTVAIVVAFDNASAEADLAIYRAHFGLPACTTANGCFSKFAVASTNTIGVVGLNASITANPATAAGWAAEADADLDMISAVCPNCKIALFDAASDSINDLTAAVGAAIARNASIVNASFGAPESIADLQLSPIYANAHHVKVVAASGDWGYGVYFPASDPSVVAVGGTTLAVDGSTVSETVWNGTGSGCSTVFAKPVWQTTPAGGCANRVVADVSAIADPNTGVAVYDSTLPGSVGGWAIFGGTSIAAPIISGLESLAATTTSSNAAQNIYSNPQAFLLVTSGSNGSCPPVTSYLCTAGSGYNGPTGNGVPHGLNGF